MEKWVLSCFGTLDSRDSTEPLFMRGQKPENEGWTDPPPLNNVSFDNQNLDSPFCCCCRLGSLEKHLLILGGQLRFFGGGAKIGSTVVAIR